jgi:hypothetical protein
VAAVNDGSGAGRLTADWALLGKHPGQLMGYEVLDGSLPPERAETYLWGAATGTPDSRDPASTLPWRVFLGNVSTDSTPVCATVETTWDGGRDGTGAPSYSWRLFLLDWPQAAAARLTWSALDEALPRDDRTLPSAAVPFTVRGTPAGQLAAQIDELGFEWTASVAALLLDNQRVAIVPPRGVALPNVTDRVRILDAVCALLPYGSRSWLSAATWTGQADHDMRLVFAAASTTGQVEVWLGTGSPPPPQGGTARSYLNELLRLRAKPRPTEALVEHLLGCTDIASEREPAAALAALRRADLLDSVIEAIRQGRGDLNDVQELLTTYDVDSLGEHRLAVLVPFLARCAEQGSATGHATELLRRHWSRFTPQLLAEHVLVGGSTPQSIDRAEDHLQLMRTLAPERPGAFDALLTALVNAPSQSAGWTGTLVYMVERTMGRTSESADTFVIRSREAGLAWLGTWLADRGRNPASLVRLVTAADRGLAGWLRFAAAINGRAGGERATEQDAKEFVTAHEEGWEVALDRALTERRPEILALLWPSLREVTRGREGVSTRMLSTLDRLVPHENVALAPEIAATADLLGALCAHAADRAGVGMPRSRLLADTRAAEAYVSALSGHLSGDEQAKAVAAEGLLGDEPDANSWAVLTLLMGQRPTMESFVCDSLDPRISRDHALWLQLDLRQRLVTSLSRRPHLLWLRPVCEFHAAIRDERPAEHLAGVIAASADEGTLGPQLLATIADFIRENGAWAGYQLAAALHFGAPQLDVSLYAALSRDESTRGIVPVLREFHESEVRLHNRLLAALQGRSYTERPHHTPDPTLAAASPMSAPMMPSAAPARHAQRRWPWRWRIRRPVWFQGMR